MQTNSQQTDPAFSLQELHYHLVVSPETNCTLISTTSSPHNMLLKRKHDSGSGTNYQQYNLLPLLSRHPPQSVCFTVHSDIFLAGVMLFLWKTCDSGVKTRQILHPRGVSLHEYAHYLLSSRQRYGPTHAESFVKVGRKSLWFMSMEPGLSVSCIIHTHLVPRLPKHAHTGVCMPMKSHSEHQTIFFLSCRKV